MKTSTTNPIPGDNLLGRGISSPAVFFLILNMLAGCANLYKIQSANGINAIDTLAALKNSNKEFIIHFKDTAFLAKEVLIKDNKIEGELSPLNMIQLKYLHPRSKLKNQYEKKDAASVLNEVHLYTASNPISDTAFSIPVSTIFKIDVNQKNVEATKRSHVIGGIIIGVSVVGLMTVLTIAVASSVANGIADSLGNMWGG